jgi:predicted methyltransferase
MPLILQELHRVLKPGGRLSVSEHHLPQAQIGAGLTQAGLLHLAEKGRFTHRFVPRQR